MNNRIKFLPLIIIFSFFLFPSLVFADDNKVSIKNKTIWTRETKDGGLGLKNEKYNTKGYRDANNKLIDRETKYLGGWNLVTETSPRVFCVEPGITFPSDETVKDYKITTDAPTNEDHIWDVANDEVYLKKVFSCWSENNNSILATQAIVWELVSEERVNINEEKILAYNDYKPYMSNGEVFGDKDDVTSLYELITNHDNMYNAYKSVLRCAARFNVKPSFSYSSDSSAKTSAKLLSNYDDTTQTFSYTFKHSSNLEPELLKYYVVTSSDSSVVVTKTNNSITVSTNKEYKTSADAVKITLKYAYKDDAKSALNTNNVKYYLKTGYQTLAIGSDVKETYLYVYTGEKPTYQLRVQKQDEEGNNVSGIKFNVYSDANLNTLVGTTTATDSSGWAYLTGIKEIGNYYIQEVDTPDGYVTNKKVVSATVSGENKTGSASYATASETFINEHMHLTLSKRTIDEEGNEISISDYSGASCTGDYKGPVFTIEKNNEKLCFQQTSAGNYKIVECNTSGSTEEIKTCDGKFDIEKIESGCYDITEITAPDGYTLPSNPTQQVCVTKGQSATATVMYNGVTGVIFNKITENGNPIDGGKFALQQKVNGVYRDMLLKHDKGAIYVYEENLKEEDGTYLLETLNGTINVKNLPPGEYRFVEKEAPEGYDAIQDKDSNAKFTISDKGIFGSDGKPATDYYQVKLVNQQSKVEGSYDSAELIVTIITGRKVANYTLIIAGLAIILTILIILRKKFKK